MRNRKEKRTELRAHKRCAILLNDYLLVCAECSYCSYNLVSHFLCVFDGRRRRRFRLRPSHRNLLKFIARFLLDSMRLHFGWAYWQEGKSPAIRFWPTDGRKYFPIMDNNFLFISLVSVSLVVFIVLRFQQIKIYDCDDRS